MFMFNNGIHQALTAQMFMQMPRHDQNMVMQALYDQGYSGKDIAKFLGMNEATVYGRISAHRGRGPAVSMA